MRTVGTIIRIASQESPLTLAREFAWQAWKRWKKKRFATQVNSRCPAVRFRQLPYYRPDVNRIDGKQRACLLSIANHICEGRFPFLSYGAVDLGFPPRWNVDFVSGKDWPLSDGDYVNYVRLDGSDVKVPWELSRLQFLPVLGKAYQLTGQECYREAAKVLLSDWIEKNPVGRGVNWTVAMEAALRALSIILLLNLLWPMRDDEQEWFGRVVRSLWSHLLYIESHLEFSHVLRSNHYLSNIVALLGLSFSLEGKGMIARRQSYQRLVEREILCQVYEDGGDYEASAGYQVLVTQLFTTAFLLMRASQVNLEQSFQERLARMYEWINSLTDERGQLPHVGDCDDGRVELLFDDLEQIHSTSLAERNSLRVSSLINVGAMLFGMFPHGQTADSIWYGLEPQTAPVPSGGSARWKNSSIVVLPRSGIGVSRRGIAEILFFAMPNGIYGKGSHTHNDKLSLVLRLDGEEMLCDSGTLCYTRDPGQRNRFRSTAAHNTATINMHEQNTILAVQEGIFSLGNEAQVSAIEQFSDGEDWCLRASHFGYQKIGVTHTRLLKVKPASGVIIQDSFAGAVARVVDLHFHFGPKWRVTRIDEQPAELRIDLQGTRKAELRVKGVDHLAAEKTCDGISRLYGSKLAAEGVRLRLRGSLPLTVCSDLWWEV